MSSKTPVYLLTGFLGSGKTTMINHILNNAPKGKKVAIVVNEFGKVSIDGSIIREEGYDVAELVSGCICCTLKTDMVRTLLTIKQKRAPDMFLIEPTGLADPEELAAVIGAQDEFLFRSIYGLVSVASYREISGRLPIVDQQIRCAHTILLSKCDLADGGTVDSIANHIRENVSPAPQYQISNGSVDAPLLFPELYGDTVSIAPSNAFTVMPEIGNKELHQDEYVSMVVANTRIVNRCDVEVFLEHNRSFIVRAKGMLQTEKGVELLQWTLDSVVWVEWRNTADTSLVIIAKQSEASRLWPEALQLLSLK